MAAPQVNGTYTTHNTGGGMYSHSIDISAVPEGAWMVVTSMCVGSLTMTPPSGWTEFVHNVQSGTRRNFLYAKIREAGDGNTATFAVTVADNIAFSFIWGTGADSVNTWTLGTQWTRSQSLQATGSRTESLIKSVTPTHDDSLVLAISHEATLAMTQSNEIASISPSGWTQRVWLSQFAANDRAETIWIGSKAVATPGATGDVTVAYLSPQDSNGWTVQLVIPPGNASEPILSTGVIGAPTMHTGFTGSEFTLNRPADAQTGDYVVVAVRGQSSTVSVQPASDGFTRLGPAFVPSTNTYRLNGFYGRPIIDIDTEPESYTFTLTAAETNTRFLAAALLVRGVNLEAPLAGYANSYGGTAITGGVRVEAYTLADTPVLSLFMAGAEFTASNDHVPSVTPIGYNQDLLLASSPALASSRTVLWVGSKEQLTSPVDAGSITWVTPVAPVAEGISLRTIDTPAPDPQGNGYDSLNGQGDPVKVYYTDTDGVRTPSTILPMRRGFNTVAEMLATPGSTWAHRGGSVTYPEHSLHGYTQSVARGYGVLEISLGRTSDGVWFGLHDQTTDRTSGGTYGNASSQTWAQIQMQQILTGPGGPQPYMTWNELVEKYGSTHIIVADPKYALGSYRTEFLNMVYNTVGTERAIIKYSGVGSGAAALSTAAQAMGFTTWGYFYAADASAGLGGNGNLQTWGPSWTLIGMEYGASQAIWDEALALGKPVFGHIAPNQAAYNTAMSKGATGVQVGGVGVVTPVSWWTQ